MDVYAKQGKANNMPRYFLHIFKRVIYKRNNLQSIKICSQLNMRYEKGKCLA